MLRNVILYSWFVVKQLDSFAVEFGKWVLSHVKNISIVTDNKHDCYNRCTYLKQGTF